MKHDTHDIDRRSLLAGAAAVGGWIVLGSHGNARVKVHGELSKNDGKSSSRTLVLLQLTGGNDALNMVAPYADDAYAAARPNLRIKPNEALKLDDFRGLHPNLKGMRALYGDGRLAIVEGCGYPNPIRSHFQSFEIWHTADPRGRNSGPGWIGKLCDSAWPKVATPEMVVHVGATAPYSVFSLTHPPLAFQTPATYRWAGTESDDLVAYRKAAEDDAKTLEKSHKNGQDAMLRRLRGVLVDANESSRKVRLATGCYTTTVKYPDDDLGESLRVTAALLDARLGSRVVSIEMGGFDTHQNERGTHDNLMKRLDDALTAFMTDMKSRSIGNDVVVVVFSEFGRRVKENGSGGTDHGEAAPMLVLGNQVKGGLHGKHPSLTDLDAGDLKFTTDFRAVYGTLIDRWFGADQEAVLGARYPTLEFLT
ncbi:MAG: DUF1501 domain-containing protein [Planctomycetota bacterium]|nr:DUF1501 domain-containing protein [Planctomycetota bacterium]